jgi:hypothetical protein
MRSPLSRALILAVTSALFASAPGTASAGVFGRSESSASAQYKSGPLAGMYKSYSAADREERARAQKATSQATPARDSRLTAAKINAEYKASGGWSGSKGVARPNAGSLPVGGGWRLYLGRSVGTERRTMNGGNESTRTRTFGVGRGATISSAHGNAVFAKGWAVQSWRSATHWGSGQGTTGQFRGKTVTVGSNTRAQVRSGARPLTREERKVLNTPRSPAAAAAERYTNSLGGDG